MHQDPIKFLTNSIEASHCDHSDAYILVTGNITAKKIIAPVSDNPVQKKSTQVSLKNCAPFKDCRIKINDTFVDYVDFINITMLMYNLIEYSDNYSVNSGCLWSFKRDEIANNANVTNDDNAPSFKYKANLIANTTQMKQKME